MKPGIILTLALLAASLCGVGAASAQSDHPTATRTLQLSAFGAASGVYTGLAGGKNFSITAGGDLGLPPWHGVRPTLEIRGTYPLDRGTIDAQKSILAGLGVEFLLNHRFRPYGDFLFGRGQMNYQTSQGADGYKFNGYYYSLTTTYIDSPGAGFNYQFSNHLAIKIDGQFQRWASLAPTPSGTLYSKVGTAGLVYYFTFEGRHR
jgi:hypothetical protein